MALLHAVDPVADLGEAPPEPPPQVQSDARLNIVHVITRLLLGGAEENTVATCLHQARCGHRVTLIHGPGADPLWGERIGHCVDLVSLDSLVHPINPLADARAVREMRHLYRRLAPDIVHTHESKAGIVGRLAAATMRVPLIVHTIHIAPFVAVGGLKRRFFIAAERAGARWSHLLIAVSRGMQQAFLDTDIGGDVPIVVVHSGMPIQRFTAAVAPTDWRARIGGWAGPSRPRLILKIAAFEERKRHLPLLRALAPGLRARSDCCILFAGDGPDREACEAAARLLGVDDKVRFLGHDPAPWELVALADVCVHAAEREGLPRSAVQAIAGGKPLIVARLPGIEEIITDGVNGAITDPDALNSLAERLFELLDSPDQLSRLQAGARATDVSSWSEDRMGERIDRAYAGAAAAQAAAHEPITTVEFFGLPGAGKTSIARELVALLREQRGRVTFSRAMMGDDLPFARRSLRRLMMVVGNMLRRPDLMLRGGRRLTPRDARGKDALKTRWNFLSVLAMQARRGGKAMLVADQGLAQAIWSARVHHGQDAAPTGPLIDRLPDWIGGTLFVQVDAPAATARQRLKRRHEYTSRFQSADSIDDAALWVSGGSAIDAIHDELDGALNMRQLEGRLLRLSSVGEESPLDCARRIRDHLCRLDESSG